MPISDFRFPMLFAISVILSVSAQAQLNADREFIRERKIKSALIREKGHHQGVVLDYDQDGRLIQLTEYLWYQHGGSYSHVDQFDSLGRTIHTYFYFVKDSVDALRPGTKNQLRYGHHSTYVGDSIEISIDSSWDDHSRQLTAIRYDTTISYWQDLPTPPEHRPVFYRDRILIYQLRKWSMKKWIYSVKNDSIPDSTLCVSGRYYFEGEYRDNRISFRSTDVQPSGDSVMEYFYESWYTTHGKYDTSYFSSKSRKRVKDGSANWNISASNYGYVKSNKFFNRYYVSFIFSYSGGRSRKIYKEPWNEFWFKYIPWSISDPRELGKYRTIEHVSWQYSGKPQYTYWPGTNH